MQMTNVPPESLVNSMLRALVCMPQSLEHFVYGMDYYEQIMLTRIGGGYHIVFIYPDTIEKFVAAYQCPDKGLNIFLLCTEDVNVLPIYQEHLPKINGDRHMFLVSSAFEGKLNVSPATNSKKEFFDYLYDFSIAHLDIDYSREPFSVPILDLIVDTGHSFNPTRVNTQTINSILGNWGYETDYSKGALEEIYVKDSSNALRNKNSFDRQKLLTDQILKIYNVEHAFVSKYNPIPFFCDQFLPPLVMALPFTSPDMYSVPPVPKEYDPMGFGKILAKALKFEYTPNYTVDVELKGLELLAFNYFQSQAISPRSLFLDIVGTLHSSFRFSPYIRMPYLGYSINPELSKMGPVQAVQLARSPKSNRLIRKRMEDIGKKIVQKVFAPDTIKMLKKRPSQIVAMTDLPIEWLDIDGVPLGFSHDVCRLPETPVVSLLSQYVESHYMPYIVKKDIIEHTLVVFGNEDPKFNDAQEPVVELQKRLGFEIEQCLTKEELFIAVKKHKPEFLIIDCHGGVDNKTHQTCLFIGDDTLTGTDIVEKEISVPLVFLSACETSTTYNTVSTIANAFFQTGSRCVVTSYIPVYIKHATTTYCRLLNLLTEASNLPIHSNWLAFVSHVLRTSYIHAPLETGVDPDVKDMANLTMLTTQFMDFRIRRKIYKGLKSNPFTTKMKADYDSIIPHYLMYSILGRADMIKFASHMAKEGEWLRNIESGKNEQK